MGKLNGLYLCKHGIKIAFIQLAFDNYMMHYENLMIKNGHFIAKIN